MPRENIPTHPNAAPLPAPIRRQADAEWAGSLSAIGPKLAAAGVRLVVEPHHESRLVRPDARGTVQSACRPHPDWLALIFEDADGRPGAAEALGATLRAAGAAGAAHRGRELWHYEGHVADCCDFAQGLAPLLADTDPRS